jgi:hypothetical protein
VQTGARFFGEACHLSGAGAALRNRLFGLRAHDDYGEVDWLYGHRA